jgi:hypothetical protein
MCSKAEQGLLLLMMTMVTETADLPPIGRSPKTTANKTSVIGQSNDSHSGEDTRATHQLTCKSNVISPDCVRDTIVQTMRCPFR